MDKNGIFICFLYAGTDLQKLEDSNTVECRMWLHKIMQLEHSGKDIVW